MQCISSCLREIEKLSKNKSYRNIKKDICKKSFPDLIKRASAPLYCGEQIRIFKCRISNSNNFKGKSAGYRLIVVEWNNIFVLLKIYPKTGSCAQESISEQEMIGLIQKLEKEEVISICN